MFEIHSFGSHARLNWEDAITSLTVNAKIAQHYAVFLLVLANQRQQSIIRDLNGKCFIIRRVQ